MWARYRDIFFDNWNKHQETKCFGYLSSNTKKFNLDDLAKGFLFHKYLIPLSAHSDFNLDQKTQYWKSIDSLLQNLDLLIEKTDYEIIKFTLNTAISHTEYFKKFDGKVGVDEEQWLSCDKPKEIQKPNIIFGDCLFVHYAFFTQVQYIDNTDILELYKDISINIK